MCACSRRLASSTSHSMKLYSFLPSCTFLKVLGGVLKWTPSGAFDDCDRATGIFFSPMQPSSPHSRQSMAQRNPLLASGSFAHLVHLFCQSGAACGPCEMTTEEDQALMRKISLKLPVCRLSARRRKILHLQHTESNLWVPGHCTRMHPAQRTIAARTHIPFTLCEPFHSDLRFAHGAGGRRQKYLREIAEVFLRSCAGSTCSAILEVFEARTHRPRDSA